MIPAFLVAGPLLAQPQPVARASASTAAPTPQPPENKSPATSAQQIEPPVLRQPAALSLPAELVLGPDDHVDVELSLDERGAVVTASVLDSTNSGANPLVLEASHQLLFTPAMRVEADGGRSAVAVVVPFRFWLADYQEVEERPSEPLPERPAAAPSDLQPPVTPKQPGVVQEQVFEGTGTAEAPAREPTRRRLPRQQLLTMPGTRGDPLKAIEMMPGVARSDGEAPIIRGQQGSASVTFLDGTAIPILYHFGGLTSVVHPRLIETVDLYPGNFSSKYGRATGGVIEARLRAPKKEYAAIADVNLIDASLLLEGPIAGGWGLAVAGRRSNIDLVFESLIPEDAFSTHVAPLYWDYQAVLDNEDFLGGNFRISVFGARDAFKVFFANPSQVSPDMRGNMEASLEFHQFQLRHETQLGGVSQRAQVSFGLQHLRQNLNPNTRGQFDVMDVAGRAEWEVPVTESATVIGGLDVTASQLEGIYRGETAAADEGSFANSGDTVVVERTTIDLFNPAAFVEGRLFPTEPWLLVLGFRADYNHQIEALSLNPRLSQRLELSGSTTLKSGVGQYSAPPIYYEAFAPIGNPDIKPQHAWHFSLGAEQRLLEELSLDVEGFYQYLYDRVVNTEGHAAPFFINDGRGRIYGLETSLQLKPLAGFRGLVSYTLSRSERQDRDEAWRLFDQDQTHILNASVGVDLGAGWDLGLRFRYVSGDPYTEVTSAIYDAGKDNYVPVPGPLNGARNQPFNQLDVRVQKAFHIGAGKLTAYLDVQNVYNASNPQGYDYSYNYEKRESVSGLPFFPSLGLRGEL